MNVDELCAAIAALAACSGAPAPDRGATPTTTTMPTPPAAFELASAPELVTPASSELSEVRLAVSPDGATMLWGSTNRPEARAGKLDLYRVRYRVRR